MRLTECRFVTVRYASMHMWQLIMRRRKLSDGNALVAADLSARDRWIMRLGWLEIRWNPQSMHPWQLIVRRWRLSGGDALGAADLSDWDSWIMRRWWLEETMEYVLTV